MREERGFFFQERENFCVIRRCFSSLSVCGEGLRWQTGGRQRCQLRQVAPHHVSPLLQDGWKVKPRLVFKCEVQRRSCTWPECYFLESGPKSASRPRCSVVSKSLSGFGFLKSDGRFRMCTSFLNCWHRAVCGRGDRVRGETGVKHGELADNGHVELQQAVGRVPLLLSAATSTAEISQWAQALLSSGWTKHYPQSSCDEFLELVFPLLVSGFLGVGVWERVVVLVQSSNVDFGDLGHHRSQLGVARTLRHADIQWF